MKIAFVIEYFPPFVSGGSEWSTYYLARDLAQQGHDITIITPNYGAQEKEIKDGTKVVRFPFYIKLAKLNKLPGHFALTNPLWLLWTAVNIFLIVKKEKPDIIHVQGKYSIPPAYLANLFFKKPLIATIRDYMMICNYGICLMGDEQACNLKDFFLKDFINYTKIYIQKKNIVLFGINLIYAVWGRLSKNYIKFFVNKADYLTCLSNKQRSILKKNGIKPKIETIYTNYAFRKVKPYTKSGRNILFAGRLTYGKGIELFLAAVKIIKNQLEDATFTIIGQGALEKTVQVAASSNKSLRYLRFVSHEKLQEHFHKSTVSVVPSIWPDPLPRVAMESIANGTPVVATNSGGLPEIVVDKVYGYVSETNPVDLSRKIIMALKNEKKLRTNIYNDFEKLSNKYGANLAKRHIEIYKTLMEKDKSRN